MFLLPRIQLSQGDCVDTLLSSEGEVLPLSDPKEVATRFQGMGAVGLDVVDVDAAQGKASNDDALLSILDSVHIPVQCGGGVRSMKRIQELRDTGARRVVIGSMSVMHPDWFEETVKIFQEGLVVNLDERDGKVLIKGRTEDTGKSIETYLDKFDSMGLEAIVITSLDATPHEKLLRWCKDRFTPMMVHAGFDSLQQLQPFHDAGVRAAILGAPVYDQTLDFEAATKHFKGS